MKKDLIIYGIGKFAEYVAYLFENDTDYNVVGFCIEKDFYQKNQIGKQINNEPVLIFENLNQEILTGFDLFVAVGNNEIRSRIFKKAKSKGYAFANYISSKSITWNNLKLGSNIFIGEGSVIQPFVEIDDNSLIIGGRIGHHCFVGQSILMSGSTIGGNSKIGDFTFLGLNSTIAQNVIIGSNNIISMNVNIEKDTDPNSVYTHKGTVLRNVNAKEISSRFLL